MDETTTTETPTERERERMNTLRAIRDRMARQREAHDAELKRRTELPEAACAVCGSPVPAGEGVREPFADPATPADRAALFDARAALPPDVDDWRRRHDACSKLDRHGLLEHVAGVRMSPREAGEVPGRMPIASEYNLTSAEPFGFLGDDERADLAGRIRRTLATLRPSRSPRGACAMCGVVRAVGWTAAPSGTTWPDGGSTAFCGACAAVWRRRGLPRDAEALRRVAYEALTGTALALGVDAPAELRLFCESAAADRDGTPAPWMYSEGCADLRRQAWTRHPEAAPPELRDAARQWHDEDEREHDARRARQAEDDRRAEAAAHW